MLAITLLIPESDYDNDDALHFEELKYVDGI